METKIRDIPHEAYIEINYMRIIKKSEYRTGSVGQWRAQNKKLDRIYYKDLENLIEKDLAIVVTREDKICILKLTNIEQYID